MRATWLIVLLSIQSRTAPADDERKRPAEERGEGEDKAADDAQDIAPDDEVAPPKQPTPAPTPTPPLAPTPRARPVHTMDEVTIPTSFLRFGINFFGDTSVLVTTPDQPHSAFAIGALGVRLLGQLSESLDALAELAFETKREPLADVEQVQIRWRTRRGVLEVGRMHTDIDFWNRAYHHGLWLQTPIERPRALRFEDDGGIIPVHWVGGHFTLAVADAFSTVIGVGNGRGRFVDDILVNSETNEAKSALLKLRVKSSFGEAGVGAIYDVIAPADAMTRPALPDQKIHEVIGSAYIAIRGAGVIAIGEGFAVRHQAGNANWMTYAGYGLLGYAVIDKLTPYVAVDTIVGADDDPFFRPDTAMSPLVDFVEVLAGARIDVSTWSALKLEVRFDRLYGGGGANDYTGVANWSFGL